MTRDNICIWRMFYVCCGDCVGVCGNVCCVAAVVANSGLFKPWRVDVCCVFVYGM